MTALYLTNNPQLAGTARILRTWLELGRQHGLGSCVVVPKQGELSDWLSSQSICHRVSAMPWPEWKWPIPSMAQAVAVARWAKSRHVALIHANEHNVYPFAVMLRALLRVPLIVHIRFSLDRGFCEWAFRGWRAPDALLWTSHQQRRDCADAMMGILPEDRQYLIPLGPDLTRFHPSSADRSALRQRFDIREDEIAIGTATALRPIKRIDDFIDLSMTLARRHSNVVMRLAGAPVPGDEGYRARIEDRIRTSGLGRRLSWLGHLEPIEPFFQSLDIFTSTSEYETFGNSVCEAMACGVPVAAYVGGSVHEVIGDAGLVVPNRDVSALTDAIDRYVVDPELRGRMSVLSRQRVTSEFNPVMSFERLLGVYRRCVGPSAQA